MIDCYSTSLGRHIPTISKYRSELQSHDPYNAIEIAEDKHCESIYTK